MPFHSAHKTQRKPLSSGGVTRRLVTRAHALMVIKVHAIIIPQAWWVEPRCIQ